MSGILSPRGYRVRVTADQATSPFFESTGPNKRIQKREGVKHAMQSGLGARVELLGGPNLNAGFFAARVVPGKTGKPKLLVEPTPGLKAKKAKR